MSSVDTAVISHHNPSTMQTLDKKLQAVREQVAREKARVRQFVIQIREQKEREEALEHLEDGLTSEQPSTIELHSASIGDSLAPDMAVVEHRSVETEKPEEDENNDEVEDDFDMFSMRSPTPRKRKHASGDNTIKKKLAVTASHLRAVDSYDDAEGYYRAEIGEFLRERFKVLSGLCGKGVFSSVVRCIDTERETNTEVAIKIIRSNDLMRKAGEKEAEILRRLNSTDKEGKRHVISLIDTFDHRGHLCLVFEAMSINLRSLLKTYGKGKGLNLQIVMTYGKQLMIALKHIRKNNVIHADIKPDNILASSNLNTVKICDLGSACDVSENEITDYLVSRYYRAPEVMLGLRYGCGIDMWSMTCTLYELAVGSILFVGIDNNDMLYQMMQLKGRFPNKLLRSAQFAAKHFTEDFNSFKRLSRPVKVGTPSVAQQRVVNVLPVASKPTRSLHDLLLAKLPDVEKQGPSGRAYRVKIRQFADFLERGLALDPAKRLTPDEALHHDFITKSMKDIIAYQNDEYD